MGGILASKERNTVQCIRFSGSSHFGAKYVRQTQDTKFYSKSFY